MKPAEHSYRIDVTRTEEALFRFRKRFDDIKGRHDLQGLPYTAATDFVAFAHDHGACTGNALFLTEAHTMQWMRRIAARYIAETSARSFAIAEGLFSMLHHEGIASGNPLAIIKARFGKKGWKGIAEALHAPRPERALRRLIPPPAFPGDIGEHAQAYLELRRAAGIKPGNTAIALRQFCRFLDGRLLQFSKDVTPSVVLEWARGLGSQAFLQRKSLLVLEQFFRFLQRTGVTDQNPVTPAVINSFSARADAFIPHIYTQGELEALLIAARQLKRDIYYPLKPETYELLIRLLFTLGLRPGEALRLRLADVDTAHATLFIGNTKFYKERIVPYGPRLAQHILTYLEARETIMPSSTPEAPLLFRRRGRPIPVGEIDKFLPRLLARAGLEQGPKERRPRWHDLRHSFAVSRLTQWYEEGANVQNKLILLATFMGHTEIASTQVYLHMTDQLLRLANDRFYQNFGRSC